MTFSTLLWFFVIAWLIATLFYIYRIFRIARQTRISMFALSGKSHRSSRVLMRRLWGRVIMMSIFFLAAILIAYFVRDSSMND